MATTDHEEILLIKQTLVNLEKSQTEFHKEVRQSFDELKNNYSSTLANHENRIRKLEECVVNPEEHRTLLTTTNSNSIYFKLALVVSGILISIMSWHILGLRLP